MTEAQKQKIDIKNLAVLFIDVQTRVAAAMKPEVKDLLVKNARTLALAAGELGFPIVLTEQYSKGLGSTMDELKEVLPVYKPIEKIQFNCCEEPGFMNALEETGVKQVILCGMEAHVCLYQTALGLLERDYQVFVAADSVSSRAKLNWRNSLENMRLAGAVIASTEMLVFQMTTPLNRDLFKKISSWVK